MSSQNIVRLQHAIRSVICEYEDFYKSELEKPDSNKVSPPTAIAICQELLELKLREADFEF